jgi:dTDP-glucose 4,6-dehydratase
VSKRVLLTGGCGFIGGHTVEHWLANTDWHVIVLDGLRHAGNVRRLTEAASFDPSRVTLLWHDLQAPIYPELAAAIGHVDYVVHMASDSHVDRSIDDPVPFVKNNVAVTLTMLEFARAAKPEKFIQIGTDEIFGPAPDGVSHAEDAALRPSNPYSASKACQEAIAFAYWRTYGVPVICTRTMNNFGERQNPEKFVPKVIRQVAAGEVVTIHAQPLVLGAEPGNPEHWLPGSRVWLHARNHADALKFILENIEPASYALGAIDPTRFNVAGERELDNLAMAHLIARILDKPLHFELVDFHGSRPGHDLRYSLDGSALRAAGWRQPMTMDESFERSVRWTVENELAKA